ncbi:Low-affinity inorganic phosphate transporter 1 [Rubripirellula amarantea]|uniref:Phosphate transporter n=2 Tax=Rubripirellula amarantea TaxID=2527999 RepID=A0A5C5WCS6_9BACT|nr:Low-affinity inorganic phosphate transporter 1 [Rubripirellula amarantea]
MLSILLFLAVCFLAYSNGANDNFKGVATLFGSNTTDYKTAIRWGTFCTLLGSMCSLLLAQSLLRSFSGKGLVPSELVGSETFLFAVAIGAGTTVLIATLTGLPISTTHGLVGALVGSGLVATAGSVNQQVLFSTFVVPLLVSPLVALCLGALIYSFARIVRVRSGVTKEWCICLGQEQKTVPIPQPYSMLAVDATRQELAISVDEQIRCNQRYVGRFLGINLQSLVDRVHFLSAGVVSFARGLNDTPKIAALLLVVHVFDIRWGLAAVAITMAMGGLLNARKVAETMGHRITEMNHGQAVSANIATGFLVIVASRFGLPVSTTHVSVGALFGIGIVGRSAHYRSVATILLAWVITLPCAGTIAALTYCLVQ